METSLTYFKLQDLHVAVAHLDKGIAWKAFPFPRLKIKWPRTTTSRMSIEQLLYYC